MVLIYPVVLILVFVIPSFRKIKMLVFGAVLVSVALLSIWFLYASQIGILSRQIQRIFDYSGITYTINDLGSLQNQAQIDPQPLTPEDNSEIVKERIYQLGVESLITRIPSSIGIYHLPFLFLGAIIVLRDRDVPGLVLLLWILIVFGILFLTLLDHRYLLMSFPAIAILIARVFQKYPHNIERFILLALLLWIGSLYLFVDWHREALLFLPNP
jgi:hypothetical protein